MKQLTIIFAGLYESVDRNCALAAGAMIVSVFGGQLRLSRRG